MPRLLMSPVRPLWFFETTPSLYLWTPAMSMPSNVALTPKVALSRAWSAISPACSRALVGMQPRCRQVPPTLSFSMRTTDLPSSAARNAAAYPPLPPPRMTTSDWLSATGAPASSKGPTPSWHCRVVRCAAALCTAVPGWGCHHCPRGEAVAAQGSSRDVALRDLERPCPSERVHPHAAGRRGLPRAAHHRH